METPERPPAASSSSLVRIVWIIAVLLVVLSLICACTITTAIFLANAPW